MVAGDTCPNVGWEPRSEVELWMENGKGMELDGLERACGVECVLEWIRVWVIAVVLVVPLRRCDCQRDLLLELPFLVNHRSDQPQPSRRMPPGELCLCSWTCSAFRMCE